MKQPLTHATCFEDKLNSYHHFVRYLTASGRSEEALETSLSILKTLGEEISLNADAKSVIAEAGCVNQMIRNSSKNDLLDLPKLKDFNKLVSKVMMLLELISPVHTGTNLFFLNTLTGNDNISCHGNSMLFRDKSDHICHCNMPNGEIIYSAWVM